MPFLGNNHNAQKHLIWALKDINFELKKGEILGVIGPNGAGKSTLLRILCGVTKPTTGDFQIKGRVAPLIEIGAGFHPEMTGMENVYLNGTIMGMSKKELDRKFKRIVDFAELWDFIDTPIKKYSSGMKVRLGFSVAVHVEPDILLVDEVLAVGDLNFRQKCVEKMANFRKSGKTMVLVSNDMNMVRITCRKAVFLNSGKIESIGDTENVVKIYQDAMSYQKAVNLKLNSAEGGDKGTSVSSLKVSLIDRHGREKSEFRTFEEMKIKFQYRTTRPILKPIFGSGIHRHDGLFCYGTTTKIDDLKFEKVEGVFEVELSYESLPLLPGAYFLTAGIWEGQEMIPIFKQSNVAIFRIKAADHNQGLFYMQHRWSLCGIKSEEQIKKES